MSDLPGTAFPERHPDPEEIAHLAAAEPAVDADDGPGDSVRRHVAACPGCRGTLSDLRAVRSALVALPTPTLPPPVAQRLEAALAAESAGRSSRGGPRRSRPRPAVQLAAAAAAAVVVLGGGALVRELVEDRGNDLRAARSDRAGSGAGLGTPEAASPSAGAGGGTIADRAALAAQVRAWLRSGRPTAALRSADDPDVAGCLHALGTAPGRLRLAAVRPFAGEPALVLVLDSAAGAATAPDPSDVVDVRVVRPGCARGTGALLYRVDRLRVP